MSIIIIIPVYNDWESFDKLSKEISSQLSSEEYHILVVDDGSTITSEIKHTNITRLTLNQNLGHQRAIAIGLCYAYDNYKEKKTVIVLDSDGEDKPEDIPAMLREVRNKKTVVFAQRARRHEGILFKFLYICYRLLFRLLTGRVINFGNFCAIPANQLNSIVSSSFLWNHFSGSIIRSKINYSKIKFDRGKRYYGKSKMNLVSLVLHGLSAISIFIDVVSVRIMLASGLACFIIIVSIFSIITLRLTTDFFVTGWTSVAFILLTILLTVIFLVSLLICMSVLISRNTVQQSPMQFYRNFISDTRIA